MGKRPNQKREYTAHNKRTERYATMIDAIYAKYNKEIATLVALEQYDLTKKFNLADYPQTKIRIDKLTKKISDEIHSVVVNGVTAEWDQSNFKNDKLARAIIGIRKFDIDSNGNEKIPNRFKPYFNNNKDALTSFLSRKDKGTGLSERVWKLSHQYKSDLELALSVGVADGRSASELSRDVRNYLKEPEKLFRRVRSESGLLHLSKKAAAYHPGQGVYRSSCRNAMRLTRTEINMAYRTADNKRWEQMDFVVGFEVRRSERSYPCKLCEALAGKYPKDFVFVGWHPHCRCYVIPIIKTDAEFWSWDGRGEAPTDSINTISDVPQAFKSWVDENKHRAKGWSSMPYFIRDNPTFVPSLFGKPHYTPSELTFVKKRQTSVAVNRMMNLDMAKKYPNMSVMELSAIHHYTRSNIRAYKSLNSDLVSGNLSPFNVAFDELLYSGLSKLPDVEGICYRGSILTQDVVDGYIKAFKDKTVYEHPFYLSGSKDVGIAKTFNDIRKLKQNEYKVNFQIAGKKGKFVDEFSEFNGIFAREKQQEIVFIRGSKFKVAKFTVDSNRNYFFNLIEIE